MKIKIPRESVPFSFLADGAVFRGKNGSICLKFPKNVYENIGHEPCESYDVYNAYDLTNDKFAWFSYEDRVEKVQAELVLSNFNEKIT